jgi:hypothetical protein
MVLLSPGACLREPASAKAGERVGVRGIMHFRIWTLNDQNHWGN